MRFIYVINFKAYEEGTGERALQLAKIIERVSRETGKEIIACVQPTDIARIIEKCQAKVFAQHIDPVSPGSHTGWLTPFAIKSVGASGALINHSERPLPLEEIRKRIDACRYHGLESIVCSPTPEDCAKISALKPDYIAVEPPELIGSGIPVSKAKPEVIIESKKAVRVPLLCGAGINDGSDARRARELGADGVLVASAIVKAKDREAALRNLVS